MFQIERRIVALTKTYELGNRGRLVLRNLGMPVTVIGTRTTAASIIMDEYDADTPSSTLAKAYKIGLQDGENALSIQGIGDASMPAGSGDSVIITGGGGIIASSGVSNSTVISNTVFSGTVFTGGRRNFSHVQASGGSVEIGEDGVWINGQKVEPQGASRSRRNSDSKPRRLTVEVPIGTSVDIDNVPNIEVKNLSGDVRVKGNQFGTTRIATSGGVAIKTKGDADVYVTGARHINAELTGDGDFEAKQITGDVRVQQTGDGDLFLSGTMETVSLTKTGDGDAILRGSARSFLPSVTGSGDLDTRGLTVEQGLTSGPSLDW